MPGTGAQVSCSGLCSPPMLVHVFAGVFRPELGEVFELHVVSWIDLIPIVDSGDVTPSYPSMHSCVMMWML